MKATDRKRWTLRLTTALALSMAVAGCVSAPPPGPLPAIDPGSAEQERQAEMLLRYCRKMRAAGDLYVAASMCQRAFDTNPTDSAPLYPLAHIYNQLGATEQAANAYRAAILINPDDVEALYGLAKATIDQGNYQMAMAQLERALQLDDDDPRIYNAMGIVKDQLGDHQTAQALYRTGLVIDPDNVSLRNNLGLSLALTGDQSESIGLLRDVAREPEAGPVGSRNLALAAQYQAPPEVMAQKDSADGPIEIRSAGPDGERIEDMEFAAGDQMAAAMSKPLQKRPGRPAGKRSAAGGSGPLDVTPRDRSIGTATGSLKGGSDAQEAAAALPKEFLRDDAEPANAAEKPAKPKATATAAKPAKAGKGRYAVQVGSYTSRKRADKGWDSVMGSAKELLSDLRREVVESEVTDGKGPYFRLRAGPLPTRAAGKELCTKLGERGVNCIVVTIPKEGAPKPAMKDIKADTKTPDKTAADKAASDGAMAKPAEAKKTEG